MPLNRSRKNGHRRRVNPKLILMVVSIHLRLFLSIGGIIFLEVFYIWTVGKKVTFCFIKYQTKVFLGIVTELYTLGIIDF